MTGPCAVLRVTETIYYKKSLSQIIDGLNRYNQIFIKKRIPKKTLSSFPFQYPKRSTMQAVVKTLHTEIVIKGKISEKVLSALMEEYGSAFRIVEKEEDDLVDVFETEWYNSVKEKTPPGRGA
jgi:hypothetical protein